MSKTKQEWVRLDNAAKIYPAAKRRNWTALFRLSMTLTEPVDPVVLEAAQRSVLNRIVGFTYRLKRGMFWYYMEASQDAPAIQKDVGNPCVPMHPKRNGGYSFRVRYYESRIAVEIFHVLTDGMGGLCFLKTLVAEYLRLKYGAKIPRGNGIYNCFEPPRPGEMEDGYLSHAGEFCVSRTEASSYLIRGREDKEMLVNITTGIVPLTEVFQRSLELGVSVTEYLTAILILSVDAIQRRKVRDRKRLKPVKINVPVNLRTLFPSETLRNFASYVNPGIDPRLGEYTLPEVAALVHHFMRTEVTQKALNAKFTTNVKTERNLLLRLVPLPLKNLVMKSVFMAVGDKKSSTCLSNLGRVELPEEMAKYVQRVDFILGPLSRNKIAGAAIGYDGKLNISFTRTIVSQEVEREFFTRLIKLGIPVLIESNQR